MQRFIRPNWKTLELGIEATSPYSIYDNTLALHAHW